MKVGSGSRRVVVAVGETTWTYFPPPFLPYIGGSMLKVPMLSGQIIIISTSYFELQQLIKYYLAKLRVHLAPRISGPSLPLEKRG